MSNKSQNLSFNKNGIERNLIGLLQQVQDKYGYITKEAVSEISGLTNVSESEIYGIATFYSQFRFTKPGEHTIKVCLGTACHVRGGYRIMEALVNELGIKPGETTGDYKFELERVACFGACALAPVVVVDNQVFGKMNPVKMKKLIKQI